MFAPWEHRGPLCNSKCPGQSNKYKNAWVCAFIAYGCFSVRTRLWTSGFAIANMKIFARKYRVFVREINTTTLEQMAQEYADFLENLILKHPKQWFNFFDFFTDY